MSQGHSREIDPQTPGSDLHEAFLKNSVELMSALILPIRNGIPRTEIRQPYVSHEGVDILRGNVVERGKLFGEFTRFVTDKAIFSELQGRGGNFSEVLIERELREYRSTKHHKRSFGVIHITSTFFRDASEATVILSSNPAVGVTSMKMPPAPSANVPARVNIFDISDTPRFGELVHSDQELINDIVATYDIINHSVTSPLTKSHKEIDPKLLNDFSPAVKDPRLERVGRWGRLMDLVLEARYKD